MSTTPKSIASDEQRCVYSDAPQAARLVLSGVMLLQAIMIIAVGWWLVR